MKVINKTISLLLIILGIVLLSSCEKEAGEGGTATITGSIFAEEYSNSGLLISSYYAPEERVYIIYGESTQIYDDEVRTDYDGRFKFEYLTKGDYTIYVYSSCSSCPSGVEPIFLPVEINKRGKEIVLETVNIIK